MAGPEAVWWSTYSVEPLPATKGFDRDDIHRQLRARHSSWKDAAIQKIVANASIDSIYPTWTTPELPTWEREGVVLVGDAAHALQPSSGQGASQALEDAEMVSILLSHYLAKLRQGSSVEPATTRQEAIVEGVESSDSDKSPKNTVNVRSTSTSPVNQSEAVALASKAYFRLRAPRVKRIRDRAKYGGDMKRKKGFIGEWITYIFIWLFGEWVICFLLPHALRIQQLFLDVASFLWWGTLAPVHNPRQTQSSDETLSKKLISTSQPPPKREEAEGDPFLHSQIPGYPLYRLRIWV